MEFCKHWLGGVADKLFMRKDILWNKNVLLKKSNEQETIYSDVDDGDDDHSRKFDGLVVDKGYQEKQHQPSKLYASSLLRQSCYKTRKLRLIELWSPFFGKRISL